jgi:hypothetical protein
LTLRLGYRSRVEMLRTLTRREYLMWKGYRQYRLKLMKEVADNGKQLLEW